MADDDTGDKTELPTPKRLKDARKKGDVPKVQDVGVTLGFLFAVLLVWTLFGNVAERVTALMNATLAVTDEPFLASVRTLGGESIRLLIDVSLLVLVPIALFATLVEYLVTGPVLTSEKLKPKMSHLNPMAGLKRMFGADNLVELLKSVFKTAVLATITLVVVRAALGDLAQLPWGDPADVLDGMAWLSVRVFGWASAAFVLLMFLDALYQKHSFTKRMKMSLRDIREELKESEGNPMLRGARKDIGQEWANEAPTDAARNASVLVVNPVHVAIALRYDPEEAPVPLIVGRGEERVAREMREAATEARVPVLRNVALARALLAQDPHERGVPRELFDVVAEVILWAQSVRRAMREAAAAAAPGADASSEGPRTFVPAPPGEDMTDYARRPAPASAPEPRWTRR